MKLRYDSTYWLRPARAIADREDPPIGPATPRIVLKKPPQKADTVSGKRRIVSQIPEHLKLPAGYWRKAV